jgi:transcription elongation factor Elf1
MAMRRKTAWNRIFRSDMNARPFVVKLAATQVCLVCGQRKPISEFSATKTRITHTCERCTYSMKIMKRLQKEAARSPENAD